MPSSVSGVDKTETGSAGTASARRNSAISSTTEDELGQLPEGWEERLHSDGRIFFIDHSTVFMSFYYSIDRVFDFDYFMPNFRYSNNSMGRPAFVKSSNRRTCCSLF